MGLIGRSFQVGSNLITGALTQVNELSGGVFLGSGSVFGVMISNISGNSPVWIGGTSGSNVPTSGRGLILYGSDPPVQIPVNAVDDIRVTGVSGQFVSWVGLVK